MENRFYGNKNLFLGLLFSQGYRGAKSSILLSHLCLFRNIECNTFQQAHEKAWPVKSLAESRKVGEFNF